MIPGVAEYLDLELNVDKYHLIFDQVADDDVYNTFGKTKWHSYSLEHNYTGEDLGENIEMFDPILQEMYKVHPHMQKRSTGFNTANNTEKDLFIHTDVDYDTEHPKYFNMIVPIMGKARIDYYETREDEIWLPELNAHGYAYYHEFYMRNKPGYEEFKKKRKIGEIIVEDRPVLLDTNLMHGVEILEAPRIAWCSRWNNIPIHHDFYSWKARIERILST